MPKKSSVRAVYQLNVSLRRIEPLIWRRILVYENTKLPRLHRIMQLLFNWEDYHLHEFRAGRRIYSVPDPDDEWSGHKTIDERDVPLNRIAERVGGEFDYHYDFGDGWEHRVLLEAILLAEADAFYPRCVAGARNGPPEDAGGAGGYASYLDALADPEHPEHENMLAWRGPFDPEEFSLERVNAALRRSLGVQRKTVRSKAAGSKAAGVGNKVAEEFARRLRAIILGESAAQPVRQKIAPGEKLVLELTDRERELILEHSFAEDDLTRRLRIVPAPGAPAVVRYSLGELDELGGHVAAEANHCKNRKLEKEWDRIFEKIDALLSMYTDEE